MRMHGETPELTEEMWLDEESMITAMSFAKLTERHRMQCDNYMGASFQVHTEVGVVKFKQSIEGLCHHEFSPEFLEALREKRNGGNAQSLAAVEDNAVGHTKAQQEKAKEARKLCHIVGAPTVKNFKFTMKSDQIQDCPITVKDIEAAEQIYGKRHIMHQRKDNTP